VTLAGQVALVSGGTGALGRAVTAALLEAGAARGRVTFRGPAQADALREALGPAARERLGTHAADLTGAASVGTLAGEVLARSGRLDILVNAARAFAPGDLLAV
jgi:NAD(P)-dependent dehydrogenase (short-subunit alcohol dehydrogenase family)